MTPAVSPLHEVPPPSPTNLSDALPFYTNYHLAVTPVRSGEKKGRIRGWSAPGHGATKADFRADDNIAVLNGCQPKDGWFFHDIDIDANTDAARSIVEQLLPTTDWRYGRASKPRSHAGYLVAVQLRTRRYYGIDGKVTIELRGVTQKGTYTLSVAPGSTHESGEPIRFVEPRGLPGRVDDPPRLELAVQQAAVGIAIEQCWPQEKGARHQLRLAFSKILLEDGLSVDLCIAVLEAVMRATGSDASDVASAVRSTADAMQSGHTTAGASTVLEVLGDETGEAVLGALRRILRPTSFDESTGVVMRGGELSEIVDRAEDALLRNATILQRGGELVRPIKLDVAIGEQQAIDAVRRSAGSTILVSVREPWLAEQMGRVLRWFKAGSDGSLTPADPKAIYARTLLSRGQWRFPVLRRVVTAPTLDRDGRIIATPGFDTASGLLLDFAAEAFPPIRNEPTRDDAHVALDVLAQPLRAFPFVDAAAQSVALAAFLTALVRPSLRTAPLHGFDAPTAGTGKSLLAEAVGLVATGVRPPALSQGKSDEEDEKRLSTVLFAGDPVIHIDNCERPISGDFLCSMLTQEVVQARILGLSERRVLPSTTLVLVSGNNLTFAGDTSRRSVVCRLDAHVERPDTRMFDFDVHAEIMAARSALVVAGLTVLRAYVVAGRPVKLTPMGSFADWDWIRGALVWLGHTDPADTRAAILDNDPRKGDLLEVMELWEAEIGTDSYTDVRTIDQAGQGADCHSDLRTKLVEVACRGGKWSSVNVGRWLQRHKDRVVTGRSFTCRANSNHTMEWKLVRYERDGQPALPIS